MRRHSGLSLHLPTTLHGVRTSPFRTRRGRGRENGVQKRVFREKLALDTLGAHKQHDQRPHGLDIGACRNGPQIGRFGENLAFESTFLEKQTLLKRFRFSEY